MKLPNRRSRAAFTLIEIIIVIAIIAIILSIAVGAYFRVYVLADQLSARSDITQLSAALDKIKGGAEKKGGRGYPPSRLKLACRLSDYGNTQLDKDSITYLEAALGIRNTIDPNDANDWQKAIGIDWTGLLYTTGSPGMVPGDVVILEGDQVLVFALGGAQSTSGGGPSYVGFSDNPKNPMSNVDSNSGNVVFQYQSPSFQFKGNRLAVFPHLGDPRGLFPSYTDSYGKNVYAYFSAYNRANGYNRYFDGTAASNDCATLGVWPYAKSLSPTKEYQNPETFQIICAGRDGTFGPGSDPTSSSPMLWTPGTATLVNGSPPGYDDMSNFHGVLLGIAK